MQAITYSSFGGPERLELGDRPDPVPGDGEVLVRVRYAGVNPLDWKVREGWMQSVMPFEFPITPGVDASAVVISNGPGASTFTPGDRVFCYYRGDVFHHGSYGELLAVPESQLAVAPQGLGLDVAASVPVSALTAWQSLYEFAALSAGEQVLITAGSGGVGSFAIQLAKLRGAAVAATASAPNHDYLKQLGADHCIDYRESAVMESVREVFPDGCDVVLDGTDGDAASKAALASIMKPGGRLAQLSALPDMELAEAGGYAATFIHSRPDGAQLAEVARLLESGALMAPQIEVMPIQEAAEAQVLSRQGHVRGKLVLAANFQTGASGLEDPEQQIADSLSKP